MINFPNTPTDGQVFTAPSGVTYVWRAAQGVWLTYGGTGQSGGDFYATATATIGLGTTAAVLVPTGVVSGNSGNWYSTTTGRWIPPAGRYCIYAWAFFTQGGGNATQSITLYKNGVAVPGTTTSVFQATSTASQSGSLTANVDANGTDYFDVRGVANATGSLLTNMGFGAFPLTASPVVAPAITWRQLSRQTLSNSVDVNYQNIPGDINELDCHFDLLPVTGDSDMLVQFYGANGVLDNTSGHYVGVTWGTTNIIAANANITAMSSSASGITQGIAASYSTSGYRVGAAAGIGIKGHFKVVNIKAALMKMLVGQCGYVRATDSALQMISFSGHRNIQEAITGVRLVFGSGNVASGSFELWGSP